MGGFCWGEVRIAAGCIDVMEMHLPCMDVDAGQLAFSKE